MAHYYDGAWHIQTLARTTFRQAPSQANASSVGLALDRLQALKVESEPDARGIGLTRRLPECRARERLDVPRAVVECAIGTSAVAG